MSRRSAPSGRPAVLAALALAAFVGGALVGGVAHAAPPTGLSITVTDGLQRVTSNTDVTYAVTLTNAGAKKVAVTVVLTTPSYVRLAKLPGTKGGTHEAAWTVTARAGKTVTRTARAHIGAIQKGDYRVTTLASVYLGSDRSTPVIRSAVANTIAGVIDPGHTSAPARRAAPTHHAKKADDAGTNTWLVVGVPVIGVAALLAGILLWRRRRSTAPGVESSDGDQEAALAGASTAIDRDG